jgi:hypothetical protein
MRTNKEMKNRKRLDYMKPFFLFYNGKGVWLSWLKRRVHIAEIPGSNPGAPMLLHTVSHTISLKRRSPFAA